MSSPQEQRASSSNESSTKDTTLALFTLTLQENVSQDSLYNDSTPLTDQNAVAVQQNQVSRDTELSMNMSKQNLRNKQMQVYFNDENAKSMMIKITDV